MQKFCFSCFVFLAFANRLMLRLNCLATSFRGAPPSSLVRPLVASSFTPPPNMKLIHSRPPPAQDTPSPFYSPGTEPPPLMDFCDSELAYKNKSTLALMRSLVVLRLCQSKRLVENAQPMLNLSEKVVGERITNTVLRNTFFKHFCAGEDRETIRPTVDLLKQSNVKCILDYAAEADVTDQPEDRSGEREGVVSARLYDYLGEEECDKNMDIFLSCMEAAEEQENGFVAVKLTALCRPVLLERMTSLLLTFRELWTSHVATIQGNQFDSHDYYIEDDLGDSVRGGGRLETEINPKYAHYGDMRKDVVLTKQEFVAALKKMSIFLEDSEYNELFGRFDVSGEGTIDYIEWNEGLNLDHVLTDSEKTRSLRPGWANTTLLPAKASEQLVKQLTELGYLPIMNEAESVQYLNFERRLHRIAEEAAKRKVRLLIDAEQTYMQTAIDHVTRQLQLKHNKEFPLIFGTYQCYLNWSKGRLETDIERAKRKGYWFAGKLVRGAYMVQERQRALSMGYPSPIMRTKTEVDYNYNACVEVVMQKAHRTNLMIASHNQYSIELAVGLMQKYNIKPDGGVFFAQLLGMTDNLTNVLGLQGYQSYKYLPYGRVGLVVPYLIRRAQENSGIMTSGATEKLLISQELRRRFVNLWRSKK